MGISHIRCREIMYQLWGNHVITFTGKLNLICKKKPTIFMGYPTLDVGKSCIKYGEIM